jgi:hypothetical protein
MPCLRSVLLAARTALSEDSARGADASRRAAADSVRRLEGAYFSAKSLSGQDVFPAPAAAGTSVRASATPPLLAFLRPEQLPADLAQYLDVDAQGAPGGAANATA